MVQSHRFCRGDWDDVGGARRVCLAASSDILKHLSTLFDPNVPENAELGSLQDDLFHPQAVARNSTVEHGRARTAYLRQQVRIRELELEALRMSIAKKQVEVVEAGKLHKQSVCDTDASLAVAAVPLPHLPIEVIKIILDILSRDELDKVGTWRTPAASDICAVRLLRSQCIPLEWKSIISCHFPPKCSLSYGEGNAAWNVSDIRQISDRTSLEIISEHSEILDCIRFHRHSNKSTNVFNHIDLEWKNLIVSTTGRNLLQSLVKSQMPQLRSVHSLKMYNARDFTGMYEVNESGTPFVALQVATIPCRCFRFFSPLLTHLRSLQLQFDMHGNFIENRLIDALQSLPARLVELELFFYPCKPAGAGVRESICGRGFTIEAPMLEQLKLTGFELRDIEAALGIFKIHTLQSLHLRITLGTYMDPELVTRLSASLVSSIHKSFPMLKRLYLDQGLKFTCNPAEDDEDEDDSDSSEDEDEARRLHSETITQFLLPHDTDGITGTLWPLTSLESMEIHFRKDLNLRFIKLLVEIVLGRLDSNDLPSIRSLVLHVSSAIAPEDMETFMPHINTLKLVVGCFAIRCDGKEVDISGNQTNTD